MHDINTLTADETKTFKSSKYIYSLQTVSGEANEEDLTSVHLADCVFHGLYQGETRVQIHRIRLGGVLMLSVTLILVRVYICQVGISMGTLTVTDGVAGVFKARGILSSQCGPCESHRLDLVQRGRTDCKLRSAREHPEGWNAIVFLHIARPYWALVSWVSAAIYLAYLQLCVKVKKSLNCSYPSTQLASIYLDKHMPPEDKKHMWLFPLCAPTTSWCLFI